MWELAYSGRNYSTKLGIKPACGKRGVYKGGNYSTVVGITVQWWELLYSGGNYSPGVGITVQWWELQYRGGNYCTVVGITVQGWELLYSGGNYSTLVGIKPAYDVRVEDCYSTRTTPRCPCRGRLQYRLSVLSVVLTCGVGWVQALTGVSTSAGRACRSVCPDGTPPTASGEAGVSGSARRLPA